MLNANSQQSTGTESWAGWLPVKLRFEPTKTGGQGISVEASWANVGAERLVDPFLHETVARLLLDRGANINNARDTGSTPLYIARTDGPLP